MLGLFAASLSPLFRSSRLHHSYFSVTTSRVTGHLLHDAILYSGIPFGMLPTRGLNISLAYDYELCSIGKMFFARPAKRK